MNYELELHRHEVEVHNLSFDDGHEDRDHYGYYYCRMRCGLVFKTKATRKRCDSFDFDIITTTTTKGRF